MGRGWRTARAWTLFLAVLAIMGCSANVSAARARHRHHRRTPRHAARLHRGYAPPVIGVGDVPGCLQGSGAGLGVLSPYHAHVLRIGIAPGDGDRGQALGCARAAVAAGLKINFAIPYSNRWSISRDVAFFRRVLAYYAPYAWAISVGNEQELTQGGATESPGRYAAVWRAVRPVLARLAPHALRVAGEVSPWGLSFLRAAYADGLPGAQALAVHAYATQLGFNINQVLSWERRTRLPLWVTEGLAGPGAWPGKPHREHPVALSQLRGAALAEAWLG